MLVTDYEGSELTKVECEVCGFVKFLRAPSTMDALRVRCNCSRPDQSALPNKHANHERKEP